VRSTALEPLVLLADDDPTARLVGSAALTAAGFRVVQVADGAGVLAMFDQYSPAAIILDVDISGIDGYLVCEQIRRSKRSDVPVLIVAGQDDVSAVRRAYEAGATDFISKPVHWPVLPYRLRYVLRSSALRDELTRSRRRTEALLEALPDRILLLDSHGIVIEQVSRGRDDQRGVFTAGRGQTLEDLLPAEVAHAAREHLHVALSTQQAQSFEYQLDGGKHTFESRLVPQPGDAVIVIIRDITQRHRSEERMRRLAYFDTVTGLPNRQLFVRELRRSLRQAKRMNKLVAVLYIDLDQFKRINDTLGHSVGDALLKGIAGRLESSIRAQDFLASGVPEEISTDDGWHDVPLQLARLGGDEFVVLVAGLDVREQAAAVAGRIRQTLAAPFSYEGRQFVVTPSIGVAMYPHDGADVETLLMHADTAMYQSKDAGRNTVRFFESSMNESGLDRLKLEDDLRRAIEGRHLQLYYQPKHSLTTGAVVGAEALLRWHDAERGWISPAQFIPLAEETGLIIPLGNWVIDEACRQLRVWHEKGLANLSVAINISAEQVARSDVAAQVLKAIWEHGVRPQCLELEITETLLMRDVEEAKVMLLALKNAGVRLSIDDFGTGYSSLNYLRQLPLDALKIDRSFVQELHRDHDNIALCSAIIAVGKMLGLYVIAEGVELEEQRGFLESVGCDAAQGYLFARPLPADEFERYLRNLNGMGSNTGSPVSAER
jgi:predicted signal transduction protein with EAL and GGDEF domain/DNA-binding response OmpR family regulator